MDLYKIKKDTLEPIERDPFKLEKEIQSLIEKNMDILFNLEFISTEFKVGDFILDSLCFDNETNSFVIPCIFIASGSISRSGFIYKCNDFPDGTRLISSNAPISIILWP